MREIEVKNEYELAKALSIGGGHTIYLGSGTYDLTEVSRFMGVTPPLRGVHMTGSHDMPDPPATSFNHDLLL